MLRLPILVAAGGVNSAGRTSGRHSFRRMVINALGDADKDQTRAALAAMTGIDNATQQDLNSLIRPLEANYFDPAAMPWARRISTLDACEADMAGNQLVDELPLELAPRKAANRRTQINIQRGTELLLPGYRQFEVSAAGQLPTGFDPGALYPSRNHPRGLQMTVFAASDALADLGIEWATIGDTVSADQVSVYVSSSMGQLDDSGSGGMLRGRTTGKRVTSKQCPLGFGEMPGDFVNAYILRAMGNTGPALGACATFLYNLQRGVQDIRSGRARVAVIGAAEAPIVPEVMEGYVAMGALATDAELRALDGLDGDAAPDFRKACRPFGENCGFTMAESAQVVILMDDALALELGAPLLAAVPDVYVHADGAKKSISSPGAGNFVTMARATALLRDILGEQRLRRGGMVQAHGTGTPQNRVTESEIISRVATAFGIEGWHVGAIKSFIGHSLGAASGDQLSAMLGIWDYGLLPGIETVSAIADDVFTKGLRFNLRTEAGTVDDYAIVNSKGFGGNNASAAVLSPLATRELLVAHHGERAVAQWQKQHEVVAEQRELIERKRVNGNWHPAYFFNDGVLDSDDIVLDDRSLTMGQHRITLATDLPEGWRLP